MCPDLQLLSVYMDGELPSPWKEKIAAHINECAVCKEKFENFKRLQELLKKDTTQSRVYVERETRNNETRGISIPAESRLSEDKLIEAAKERVWKKLEKAERHFYSREQARADLWQRRISIPLPAAAAAAVIIAIFAMMWISGNLGGRNLPSDSERSFMFASEEETQGSVPVAGMEGVLKLLGSDGSDVIILQLPESTSFLRAGEPAIIRAADYSERKR